MANLSDLFARLFGGGTRGLSGDADRVLLDDPELEYFNARLRRHATTEDLVEDPSVIWRGHADGRSGLKAHLEGSEYTDGLGFTDVLVVLSADDWHQTLQQLREPWTVRASKALGALLWGHCDAHDLHQVFPQRPFQFRFIQDGGNEMAGARIGLEAGQFVTGLLPNQYSGPVASSRSIISVLLNLPGVWEGYAEVGRLFSDQVQFTLGNHWLDNYRHPALQVPALYRLQQHADGSFVHIVNPDARERYLITSHGTAEGPAVLSLVTEGGQALGHMVLAIVDDPVPSATREFDLAERQAMLAREAAEAPSPPPVPAPPGAGAPAAGASAAGDSRPRIQALPRASGQGIAAPSSSGPVGPAASGGAPTAALPANTVPMHFSHGHGNRTVIPSEVDERILVLRETGALLQRVHFNKFMDGYDVYMGLNGEIGTTIRERAASFLVRGTTMGFMPHIAGIRVQGRVLEKGKKVNLRGQVEIEVAGQKLEFRDLRMVDAEGWPYLGEIRRAGGASHLVFGSSHKVGRDRRSKVRLPDEPNNDNIVWRPEMAEGGVIRSRNGEIPKSRFYTDSIMVASEHAEINLAGEPVLLGTARSCFTYVRRRGEVLSLAPSQGRSIPQNIDLLPGDEILVGNCVFAVDYPAAGGPQPLPSQSFSPAPAISAQELAQASVSYDEPVASVSSPGPADAPAAHGLGEAGKAPARPRMTGLGGPDSFMGIEAEAFPKARHRAAGIHLAGSAMDEPALDVPAPPALDEPPTEEVSRAAPGVGGGSPLDLPDDRVAPALPSFKTMDGESLLSSGPSSLDSLFPAERQVSGASPSPAPASPPPASPPPASPAPVDPSSIGLPMWLGDDLPDAGVIEVDEEQWQQELARPARLVLRGFMVSGEVVVGNHRGAQVILPENRSEPQQLFAPRDYFRLSVRGRRASVELLDPDEAGLLSTEGEVTRTERTSDLLMEVKRRAPDGEEDFRITLALQAGTGLPDPRAQLLGLIEPDGMVDALFTRGLPLRQHHGLRLDTLEARAWFDGETVVIDHYLDSYRRPEGGFCSFLIQVSGQPWRTAPEDGSPIQLRAGDRLIFGTALYELR